MSFVEASLTAFILATVGLLALLTLRPSLTAARGGKILAFVVFFIMPVVALWAGTSTHLEHAKTTDFCLSCHVMEPYGRSLDLASTDYLPAAHYQNHRVTRDGACYACHTTYTLFGDVQAKLKGMKHLLVNYLGTVPDPIELYEPYQNRECLHCHAGARIFEENDFHAENRSELESNGTSCLECHDLVHAIAEQGELELWQGGGAR